jgi:Zn-finger nucleic acid-binding protein
MTRREPIPSVGYCPHCKGPVVVKGHTIRFHWCKACRVAVDPVSRADVKFDTKLDTPTQDQEGELEDE